MSPLTPDRANLRQQLADTLHADGAYCGDCSFEDESATCPDCIRIRGGYADALLPVVEAHTAAAVRRTLEDFADRLTARAASMGAEYFRVDQVAEAARRIATEEHAAASPAREQGEAQPDTLPAWLYQRFGRYSAGVDWDELYETDQAYWAHEAAAARRAVARGGFKSPEGGDAR